MTVLLAIVGLLVLVLVHEAGHFFVARAVGMRPRRFYVGFPPALVKTTRNGIEYGIGSLPLGGYVKIPGMHRPAPQDLDGHMMRALDEAPSLVAPLERVRSALARDDLDAAKRTLPALRKAVGAAPISAQARERAERGITDVDDALSPDAYWRAPTWKRIAVIFAGPGTNILVAVALFVVLFAVGSGAFQLGFALKGTSNGGVTRIVDRVQDGHPAEAAGLRGGDKIVAIDGHRISRAAQIPKLIRASHGAPVRLTVERAGRTVALPPTRARKDDGESFGKAVRDALRVTGDVTAAIGSTIAHFVHKHREVSSVVGTVQASSSAAKSGWRDFLGVQAFISLSLGLLNLLPLLPLDGGHIAFSIIEGIRRRAVAREIYERVSVAALALLILVFFIGLSNDVGRLGGG